MNVAQAREQAWCGVVPKKVPLQPQVTRVLPSTVYHASPMNEVKQKGETPLFLVLVFCTLYHP